MNPFAQKPSPFESEAWKRARDDFYNHIMQKNPSCPICRPYSGTYCEEGKRLRAIYDKASRAD